MEADLTEAVGPAGARAGGQDGPVTGRKLQRDQEGGGPREPQWVCEQGSTPPTPTPSAQYGWGGLSQAEVSLGLQQCHLG